MERVPIGDWVLASALREHIGIVVCGLEGDLGRYDAAAMRSVREGAEGSGALDITHLAVLHPQRKLTQQWIRDLLRPQPPSRDLLAYLRKDVQPVAACRTRKPQRERKAV